MEMNGKEQSGVGGGESFSSSSDLNHSSSSSNSVSQSQSQSQSRQQGRQRQDEDDPMQSWWESVSKARSRIRSLVSLLPPSLNDHESLSSLADSDRPARALLSSHPAYLAISSSLSGSGDDPLCHWLYDTFQDDDSDLRLVVLSLVPLLSGLYLSRVHSSSTTSPSPSPGSPSLAGFEAVLLALYSSQTKSRSGKPLLVSVPTPSHLSHHPSLYHHPSPPPSPSSPPSSFSVSPLCPPLEPQVGIMSSKRASILGVALHCFYSHISLMPSWSKLELCHFAASWAGHLDLPPPPPPPESDILLLQDPLFSPASIADAGVSIPLPWELLQPLLRILAHCLLAPPPLVPHHLSDSASVAITRLYARASHDLSPQAILATRALLQLHTRARSAAAAAFTDASSIPPTPTSINKIPDMLLLSN